VTLTFPKPTTPGNLIVVAATWGDDSALLYTPTAADTAGDTYALATRDFEPANSQSLAVFYAANVAGGTTSVTVTFNAPGYSACGSPSPTCSPDGVEEYRAIVAVEYSGVAKTSPLLTTAQSVFSGGCSANQGVYDCPGDEVATSGSANVTVAGALVVGVTQVTSFYTERSAGPGFTERVVDIPDSVTPDSELMVIEDKVIAAPGPVEATESFETKQDYMSQMLVFRPAQ
jgi:hypothetical protein